MEGFEDLIKSGCYYVDKTIYLQDIFLVRENAKILLFTRPRRFGKTLNLKTIEAFCKLDYKNPGNKTYQEELFLDNGRNLAISNNDYKELRHKFMGELPVIYISFKDIYGKSYNSAIRVFLRIIRNIYFEFEFLTESSKISPSNRDTFIQYLDFANQISIDLDQEDILSTAEAIIQDFIPLLGSMLHREFGRKVLIIIDEYDVPLQKALIAKEPYYDEMLEIIKHITNATFKENYDSWLLKGIVTGCLKISHQSIFTDANNFVEYGINQTGYAAFFGITISETQKILKDCEILDREKIIAEWYDGYRIGNEHLFCPWSLLQYCSKIAASTNSNLEPMPYWINTSGNDIIELYLKRAIQDDLSNEIERLAKLLKGIPQQIELQEFDTYPNISSRCVNFDSFMTLLLQTGYLTFTDDSNLHDIVSLRIPNLEIHKCFDYKIRKLYATSNPIWRLKAKRLLAHIFVNEKLSIRSDINELLHKFLSLRDTAKEFFYHGFIYGILSMVAQSENIHLQSEVESGDGFSDIILCNEYSKTAVILEFKKTKNDAQARIAASENAAHQIVEKNYVEELLQNNYTTIYGIGIGFGGKYCEITTLGNLALKS